MRQRDGLVDWLLTNTPKNLSVSEFSLPTPAMPVECIIKDSVVESYRNYYKTSKRHLASWSGKIQGRHTPDWYF